MMSYRATVMHCASKKNEYIAVKLTLSMAICESNYFAATNGGRSYKWHVALSRIDDLSDSTNNCKHEHEHICEMPYSSHLREL